MNRSAYLACVVEPGSEATERMRRLAERLQSPGMVKLVDVHGLRIVGDLGAAHLILPESRVIIWGHLFRRADSARTTTMSEGQALPFGDFVQACWGGYVAIRRFEDQVKILRDAEQVGLRAHRS